MVRLKPKALFKTATPTCREWPETIGIGCGGGFCILAWAFILSGLNLELLDGFHAIRTVHLNKKSTTWGSGFGLEGLGLFRSLPSTPTFFMAACMQNNSHITCPSHLLSSDAAVARVFLDVDILNVHASLSEP